MGRAVVYESFGGPEVLEVREVPDPHPGPGEVRVRVAAIGLNAMDTMFVANADLAAAFGISLPAGFAHDFAGTVDEIGPDVDGFAVGDRVFGGGSARAAADFAVMPLEGQTLEHTPDGLSDADASTLAVAGRTASAVIAALELHDGDSVLVGGAAGGVGVFAVQLARIAGARVIGTASESTFEFLRELGVEPVAYGAGLVDRVRSLAPDGVTAAIDLFGTETVEAAPALGVPPTRIVTIAAGPTPPGGAVSTGGDAASPSALSELADDVASGRVTVPIAATFPLDRIRDAAEMLADRHTHGKIVVTT